MTELLDPLRSVVWMDLNVVHVAIVAAAAMVAMMLVGWSLLVRMRGGKARCGACGYIVHSLTVWNCPECGADFHEVGIESPRHRHRRGAVRRAMLFTLCVIVVALPVYAVLEAQVFPWNKQYRGFVLLKGPATGLYQSVRFDCHHSERIAPEPPPTPSAWTSIFGPIESEDEQIEVTLTRRVRITITPNNGEPYSFDFELPVVERVRRSNFNFSRSEDREVIRDWFRKAGIESDDRRFDWELRHIDLIIVPIIQGESTVTRSFSSTSRNDLFEHFDADGEWSAWRWWPPVAAYIAAAVLLWLAGLWAILKTPRTHRLSDQGRGRPAKTTH